MKVMGHGIIGSKFFNFLPRKGKDQKVSRKIQTSKKGDHKIVIFSNWFTIQKCCLKSF